MKLRIVYDNEIYTKGIGLKSDWGFACVIETGKDTILFDTGENGEILLHNMNKLNINPRTLNKIVISHAHHDHQGGLLSLVPHVNNIEVYHIDSKVPPENMIGIIPDIPKMISENVWTTGRIKGLVDEQSLVLQGKNGWYVLTGCSHPGIENILQIANQIGDIIGIVGGFHGFNRFQLMENLDDICPCHCTAHKKDLKKAFPDKFSTCGVGKVIDLGVAL